MATLKLQQVVKRFDTTTTLHGIDLEVQDGEFVVFVGPSGCGKSTLLRVIAGLEPATSGQVLIAGQDVTDRSAAERGCAMVFQSYALYPHMSVYDNMAFGLINSGVKKADVLSKVGEAARMLRLEELLQRKPTQLSGGQRQRVAIGRAIVRDPRLFLFDEPLSNLDAELRISMRAEIRDLHTRLGTTMIYVTHDQVEAMTMADKIVVLRAGKVEQIGAPLELYNRPANSFVAGFIGSPRMNFLPVTALDANLIQRLQLPATAHTIGIRPEHVVPDAAGAITLQITQIERMGGSSLVRGKIGNHQDNKDNNFEFVVNGQTDLQERSSVLLDFPTAQLHCFGADGARIELDLQRRAA